MSAEPRFNVGDKVTYKDIKSLPGNRYYFGGEDQKKCVGTIKEYLDFNSENNCWKIRVSTCSVDYNFNMLECEFEEYELTSQSKYDLILNEARARYPVGTIFVPAHVGTSGGDFCIITEDSVIERRHNNIYSSIKGNLFFSSSNPNYGNTDINRMIYNATNGWAKIIGNKYTSGVDPMISKYKGEVDSIWKTNPCAELDLPSDYLTNISLHKSDSEKPLIEPVHSVSVQLRTKKKSKQLTI
jgi:hypothetical protein